MPLNDSTRMMMTLNIGIFKIQAKRIVCCLNRRSDRQAIYKSLIRATNNLLLHITSSTVASLRYVVGLCWNFPFPQTPHFSSHITRRRLNGATLVTSVELIQSIWKMSNNISTHYTCKSVCKLGFGNTAELHEDDDVWWAKGPSMGEEWMNCHKCPLNETILSFVFADTHKLNKLTSMGICSTTNGRT